MPRLCVAVCLAALVITAAASEGDNAATAGGDFVDTEAPFGLNLLSMMEGMGVTSGKGRRVIDVGLDWKYMSATAQDKMVTPKLLVGTSEPSASLVHVEVADGKKAATFTGADDVTVEIASRGKSPTLAMISAKGRWDISVPTVDTFHIGKYGLKPTVKLVDGKMGIGIDSEPQSSLHVQSNTKSDHIMFQGNIDGKTDAMTDSLVILESSSDLRGRGVFMPHRGTGTGAATAWFAGVPNGGGGYQIGSSSSHMVESTSGPYAKSQAHMFVSTDGKVAFGHTAPTGQVDVQLRAENKDEADRALNVRAGSINVDMGQGFNTDRVPALTGEREYIRVGSAKETQEREIRLQTDAKKYVTISRYNAFVGIGGVTTPSVPLDVKGNVKITEGQLVQSMEPKPQEQMVVLNSESTVPAAVGFRQADKPYMTISGGKAGGTVEMANGASLTLVNGKFGIGTDPSEMFHVKGGDALLEGPASLWFKSKVSGTRIYESEGLRLTGGTAQKVHLENSEVVVTNSGSNSMVDVQSGPTKDSVLRLSSGAASWDMHTTMAGAGALLFSNQGTQVAMTKTGQLGVGVDKPEEALHVKGSSLFESTDKEVFTSVKTNAETLPAGVRMTSGAEEWRVMTTGAGSTDVTAGSLEFSHALKTHVVISKAGALGVGTGVPLPGTSLHVKGPSMFAVGTGKGKVVVSTPNGNPGFSFFDNDGYRRMDIEAHAEGISFTSAASFLGVGTKSPKSKLHLYDAKNTALTLSRSGKATSEGYLKYAGPYLKLGTASSDGVQIDIENEAKLTVHPNGNVGVGTAVPKSQLQVGQSSHLYQAGAMTVLAGNAYFAESKFKYTTQGGAGGVQISQDGTLGLHAAPAGAANMEVAGFSKAHLTVTPKGLIGVGTQSPDTTFHVVPAEEATLKSNGAVMIGAGKAKANIVVDQKSIIARDNGQASTLHLNPFGGSVTFFGESSKPGHTVTFSSDGNVGFGPSKPLAKLHVSEGPGQYATIGIGEGNAGIGVIRYKESMMTLGFSKSASGSTNKEDAITILKEGNVGIGNAAPKSKLSVAGNVEITGKLIVGGKQIVTMLDDMAKENKRLSMELAAAKEMLMSMSSNMKRMSEMQSETSESKA